MLLPHSRCPNCGYTEPFHPYLQDPISKKEITLEEWYRRVRAKFGEHVTEDTELPIRCQECA